MPPVSFTQTDVVSKNNAEESSKFPAFDGYKSGGGRAEFSATGGKAIAAYGLGLIIPKGAVLTRVLYKVLTTFTSATDAATLAVKAVAANDLVSAIAISNVANAWDSTSVPVATLVTPTLASNIAATADVELTVTVAVEALTAGKLVVWAEWLYHGDILPT